MVELNPDAVLVNFNRKIVFANNAALRLFGGKSLHDLLGRSPLDFVLPDERAEVERQYQRALVSGAPTQPDIQRRVRLDGSFVDVETVGAPLAWEGGAAVQIIMRDVTEQRKAERSLHILIETTQDAVLSIDRRAQIVIFNAAAERIFGYTGARVVGKKSTCSWPNLTQRSTMDISNAMKRPASPCHRPHTNGDVRGVKTAKLFPSSSR